MAEPSLSPPPPTALRALLPADVDLTRGWRHPAARSMWHGVVWGRLGRGDLAWTHFDQVDVPELQPWTAAERGRILRELGGHAEAQALELPALDLATDPVDVAMLRVSLTADAVGFGDLDLATARLQAARHAVEHAATAADAAPRVARQRLRLSWVEVEVAWLRDETPPTGALPRWSDAFGGPQLHPDHAAGSSFHTAKGLLFGGVVHRDDRLLAAALEQAPPILAWAVHLARADLQVPGEAGRAAKARRGLVGPPR